MALVKLFGNLRQLAGQSTLTVNGNSVADILAILCQQHEQLVNALFDGKDLTPYIKIIVNGHDVSLAQGLDTPIKADDTIAIFPPISGGKNCLRHH